MSAYSLYHRGKVFSSFSDCSITIHTTMVDFYSARQARIASAVLATAMPSVRLSVCLSVRLSVRHTPVLCQNDGT